MVHFILNDGSSTSQGTPAQSAIQNGSEFISLDHFEIVQTNVESKDFFTQFDKPFFDEIIFEQTIHNQNYRYIAWLDPKIDLKQLPNELTLVHSSPEMGLSKTTQAKLLWRNEEGSSNFSYGGTEFEWGYSFSSVEGPHLKNEWRPSRETSQRLEHLEKTIRKKTEKIVGKDGVISAEEFAQLEGIFKDIAQFLFKNTINVLPIDIKFDEEGKVIVVYKLSPPVEGIIPLITDNEGLPYANKEIRDELTEKIFSFFDFPYSQKNIEKGLSKLQSYFKKNKKFAHFAGLGTPKINDHNELVIPVLCKPQYLSVKLDATIADKDGKPVKNISFNPASKEIKIRYPLNERNIKELEQDLVTYLNKGLLDGHSYYVQPGAPWADGSTLHLNYILLPMPKKIELRSDVQLNPHRLEHWFKNHKPGRKQPQYTNKSIASGLARLDQYYQLEEGYLLKSGVEIDPETDEAMDARAVDLSYGNQKLIIGRPTPSGLTNLHFAKISKIDFEFYGKEDNPETYAQLQDWFYNQGGKKMLRKRLDFEGRYYKHTDVANTILAIGNTTTGYSTIIDYQYDQLERSGLPDWSDSSRIDRKIENKSGGNFPVQIVWDIIPDKAHPGDVIIKVNLAREGISISPEWGIDGGATGASPYVGATTRFMNGHNLLTNVGVSGIPLAPSVNAGVGYAMPYLNKAGTSLTLNSGVNLGFANNSYQAANLGFELNHPLRGPTSDWSFLAGYNLQGIISARELWHMPYVGIMYNPNTNTIVKITAGPGISFGRGAYVGVNISATHRKNLIPNGKLYFKSQLETGVRIGKQPSDTLAGLMNPVTAAFPLYAYASAKGGVFYEVAPNQLGVGLGIAATTNNGWSGAPALGGGLAFDAMGRIMIAGVGLDASMGVAPLIAL